MTGTGLVVPIDVVAFCVSATDAQLSTGNMAGATVVYVDQATAQYPAYMGANVARSLAGPPWHSLEAGVHVHWALPDALTKAGVDETQVNLSFPAVPNRWLVTRILVGAGGAPATRTWVVESDALTESAPQGQYPVTLPVQPALAQDQNYRFLGQSFDLASYAPTALLDGPRSFREATGAELSAVSNGVISFAAFYPESRSCFGFVDDLSDVTVAANLSYVVTGWYDATTNDPAHLSSDLRDEHSWASSLDDAPAYTLYSGSAQDIGWDPSPTKSYVPQAPPAIAATSALGNTPTEALSAYFASLNAPQNPLFEQLLNAFQQGLLKGFNQPTTDQLARIAESLHNSQFQAIDAATRYMVAERASGGDDAEAIDLPLPLANALNELNLAAEAFEQVGNHVVTFQWQMFADWYRYFQANVTLNAEVFNHSARLYSQWSALSQALTTAQQQVQDQLATINGLLGAGQHLRAVPDPRYWQPTEPAVLLAGPDLAFPSRYGGDHLHSADGTLACRTTVDLVSQVTASGITMTAAEYASVTQLPAGTLPYATDCTNLIAEALLLNTAIAAQRSGQPDASLAQALRQLLAGGQQSLWAIGAGTAPSPVALGWWGPGNPWLPVFLQWTVDFVPLQPTATGTQLSDYDSAFFVADYTVDPTTGSFISYTPGPNPPSIHLDPSTATFTPSYTGQTVLSAAAARNFETLIEQYLASQTDPTLQTILNQLRSNPTLVQPLSGFTDALLMREPHVQLNIAVPPGSNFSAHTITSNTVEAVGARYDLGAAFNTPYNPIRAGYFTFSVQAVDAFGVRRDVTLNSTAIAESMATDVNGAPVPDIAYAAPRLAQPSRLLFEWLSAAADVEEMTDHPSISPICGWLLPNHLSGGFFLYDDSGAPLGSLQLNGDESAVVWQSAPGDDATINQPIEQVLAGANPHLLAVGVALKNSAPAFFRSFWAAVDRVHSSVNPSNLAASAGLSVLIGRPVALVQAMLRLDLQGRPLMNQGWQCLTASGWTDTDNGFSAVRFPAVLGDIDKLDDGLIGYFTQKGSGYDLSRFYTEGADGSSPAVVQPTQSTLLLTPTPLASDPDPPPVAREGTWVLMLVDPRAPVHATSGILPTQNIQIPPDLSSAALSRLEMSFLTAPVLQPAAGPTMPVPRAPGYAVSWVEEDEDKGQPAWVVVPNIVAPSARGVWDYTPQKLAEGWLRLNPTQLSFALLNGSGQTSFTGGAVQTATLRVVNSRPVTVTFQPGKLQPEGQRPTGSLFYIHLGSLVASADVPSLTLSRAGWTFSAQADSRYGSYWAATPSAPFALAPGESFDITVSNMKVAASGVQAQLFFDYYDIDGVSDGVDTNLVSIQAPAALNIAEGFHA